jgi:hypothetical protein
MRRALEVEAAEGFRLQARGILVIALQATARGERVSEGLRDLIASRYHLAVGEVGRQ